MKPRNATFRRAMFLSFAVLALGVTGLKAQDAVRASTEYVPISTGTYQNLKSAVAVADAIFIAEVTDPGSEALMPDEAPRDGMVYRGVEFKLHQNLRGMVGENVTATVYVVSPGLPHFLPRGCPYIVFLQTRCQSWPCFPFNELGKGDASSIAIKLMPATDARVAAVLKLIRAADR